MGAGRPLRHPPHTHSRACRVSPVSADRTALAGPAAPHGEASRPMGGRGVARRMLPRRGVAVAAPARWPNGPARTPACRAPSRSPCEPNACSSWAPRAVTSTTSTSCTGTILPSRLSRSPPRRSPASRIAGTRRSSPVSSATPRASRSARRRTWRRSSTRCAVDTVVFAYSDVSHEQVMHAASRVLAAGADFELLGTERTLLKSTRPVVAVCAVRTGSGKSQTSRFVASALEAQGLKVAVVRHPMPYGDLVAQRVQRFETYADLDRHETTIEEREEYEPHLDAGRLVFAGVDYEGILRAAEAECDVVIWDGGNNDLPFYAPDLMIVVADPLRPGPRAQLPPGRGEPADRRRRRHQQDRLRDAGGAGLGPGGDRPGQPDCASSSRPAPRWPSRAARSAGGPSRSSRTARRSPTAA